jgi:hypothetical protein
MNRYVAIFIRGGNNRPAGTVMPTRGRAQSPD